MIKLRPYQQQAIDSIREAFSQGNKHIILQAPTGSGKTVIFTTLAKLTAAKGKKILIMTDRAELLTQTDGALRKVGINALFIQAGIKRISYNFQVYIAMSQTLRRRIGLEYWKIFLKSIDLLIIDEAHKQEFNYLFESKLFDNKFVIGFTATPKRSGKMRQLALDYTKIITTIQVKQLIDLGFLVNDDYYGLKAPDLQGVAIDRKKGDYSDKQLFNRFDSPKIYAGAVKNYQEICDNTKAIVFCVNIEHSIKTAKEFDRAGYRVRYIVSAISPPKVPDNKENQALMTRYYDKLRVYNLFQETQHLTGNRKKIFSDFNNNKFEILVNTGIATTGFDQPDIETVIVLRATLSETLWLQMLGRGSRIAHGKTHFNILDFGDNASRHGFYTQDRLWSLWHEEVKGDGLPPLKECGYTSQGEQITGANNKKGCRRPILAAYKICPFCGFKYPEKQSVEVELSNILFDFEHKKAIKTKRIKDMTYTELHDFWKMKGHKSAWLWRQLWYKGGAKAIHEFGRQYHWKDSTIKKVVEYMSN